MEAMTLPSFAGGIGRRSFDLDRSRLVPLRTRQVKSENAIPVFCSYTIGIELDRKRQRAIKFTECALPTMNAEPFGVGDCLSARDADRVFLRLNLKAVLVDSGQLDDRQDVIPLLKRIDWGKRSLAGSLIVEPTAR